MGRFLTEDQTSTEQVLTDIGDEREAQFAKWGPQHHPDGTSAERFSYLRDQARARCDEAAAEGRVTWNHILTEEFMEAACETDLVALRKELVQVAAVAVAWVEDIDSRVGEQHYDIGGEG